MTQSHSRPEVLVSTDWLEEHLGDPSIVVAEVNTDLEAGYDRGHVPGAVGWHLHRDLEDQTRRDIPGPSQLEELLSRSGIENTTTVVLYGDGNNRSATWAFWLLKCYRHKDVRLLDGGRAKWVAEGRPLSPETPVPTPKAYRACIPDKSLRATREHIVANLHSPSLRLLDTRTSEEYSGRIPSEAPQPGIYRNGRIPGAVHIPWDDGATEDGTFRSADELRGMYEGKGVTPDQEIVAYCRLGVRASYSWFVLKYLLGYERVRNYDGSWTEWGNSVGVPIETGASSSGG
ncbi:MAG: sulfurtransferase [Chloroflexi bacterium]|nr:sulfurtransferase [Chloroflexota bacterium]